MRLKFTLLLASSFLFLFGGLLAQPVTLPAGAAPVNKSEPTPPVDRVPGGGIMSFEEETHQFGELVQGGDASWTFRFTNTGTEAIQIESAHGSCGCTVPTWPKEAIAPGATGEIFVKYDSNRVGPIDKNVTIISNATETTKKIFIKGNISAKPAAPDFLAQPSGPANN